MPIDFNYQQALNAAEIVTITTTGTAVIPTGVIRFVPSVPLNGTGDGRWLNPSGDGTGDLPWNSPIYPGQLNPDQPIGPIIHFVGPPVSDVDFEMIRQGLEAQTLRALGIPREFLEGAKAPAAPVAPVEEVAHPVEKKFRRMLEP